jgi:trehalose 6-phosphate synthase
MFTWTQQSLQSILDDRLHECKLIIVANREPYIHRFKGRRIECIQPASGMVTALDPIVRACSGVWVAHGSGNADRRTVDAHDHVQVPPENPAYTLRRVWLTKEQEEGYYYGMSNEGLWPLCHVTFTRPIFDPSHWRIYREVNQLFCDAVLQEAGDRPAFVFIQDYHFALLPAMLKAANPNLIVGQFWHIPWPNRETFRVFPWKEELLEGLLGNDLLGFHIRYHCQNFLDTVDRMLEARVDTEQSLIVRGGKPTLVRPFPISIDFDKHVELAQSAIVEAEMERWRTQLNLGDCCLGIGIERLDYTKGIPERLRAVDYLLEHHPEYRGKLIFVQIAVPSRSHIPHYKQLDDEVDRLVEQINWRWSRNDWAPIVLLKEHHDSPAMIALHRLSQFALVSSLHDGMNLVAKEYVASRFDEDGMLILSQFTGAAREFTDALLVNPYDIQQIAESILQSLQMPAGDRQRRMQKMREQVARNNVYRWAGKIMSTMLKFDFPEPVGAAGE